MFILKIATQQNWLQQYVMFSFTDQNVGGCGQQFFFSNNMSIILKGITYNLV